MSRSRSRRAYVLRASRLRCAHHRYHFYPNLSANVGVIRTIVAGRARAESNVDFRRAVSSALIASSSAKRLGQRPVHDPYCRWRARRTSFFTRTRRRSTRSTKRRQGRLRKGGAQGPDGNGCSLIPLATMNGADVEVTMIVNSTTRPTRTIGETIVAQLERVGLRVSRACLTATSWEHPLASPASSTGGCPYQLRRTDDGCAKRLHSHDWSPDFPGPSCQCQRRTRFCCRSSRDG